MTASLLLRRLGWRLLLLSSVIAWLSMARGPSEKLSPSADSDTRLANFGERHMPALLEVVREFCLDWICWDYDCGRYSYEARRKCYPKLLSQSLTDAPVRRSDQVLGTLTSSTFGDYEGAGVTYCETDVSIFACLISLCPCLQQGTCSQLLRIDPQLVYSY